MAHVVIVTPNPAIDITYRVDHQTVGETHRVREVSKRAGGKGVNVARVLKAMGHRAVNVLPLGGSSGEWMLSELTASGLETIATPLGSDTRSTVAVVGGATHPTLFAEAGPLVSRHEAGELLRRVEGACRAATLLIVSGSLPPGLTDDDVASWIAAARAAGAVTLVDAGGSTLLAAARAGAHMVKPNESELREATGLSDPQAGAELLRSAGAETVVVSRGEKGLIAVAADGTHRVSAIPGITGNPTGAGDAATAGIASAIVEHLSLDAALGRAAALGAAAVLLPVAGEIDFDAYRRFTADQGVAS